MTTSFPLISTPTARASRSAVNATLLDTLGFAADDQLHLAAAQVRHQPLRLPADPKGRYCLWLRRDDELDAFESGNKRYKLYYNLIYARQLGATAIASFGGAWSNHLYALAAAGRRLGVATHGVIRGAAEHVPPLMLQDLQALGMQLHFVSRDAYRAKHLPLTVPSTAYWVPEGGNNDLGALGMAAVGRALQAQFGRCGVALAVGTGASLSGVSAGLGADSQVWGISVLKGAGSLGREIRDSVDALGQLLGRDSAPWGLVQGFHGGGYGRRLPPYLLDFLAQTEAQNPGLQLDPVYTLKMLWGVNCLIGARALPRDRPLILLHTGGLQGRRGFGLPVALPAVIESVSISSTSPAAPVSQLPLRLLL